MTTELKKQFYQCFELEIPMVKTVEYSNDPFAHCNDWWYGERTFKEAGIEEYTVNGLNQDIKEFKEKHPKEVKHNGVLTQKYRIVEAFIKYPQITDKHYLELLKLLMLDEGINITVYNIQDESKSYKEFGITCLDYFNDEPECNEEDYEPIQSTGILEDCILKALILIEEKYKGYLKHQVQAIFEGERWNIITLIN